MFTFASIKRLILSIAYVDEVKWRLLHIPGGDINQYHPPEGQHDIYIHQRSIKWECALKTYQCQSRLHSKYLYKWTKIHEILETI
jgi:hypothetical protein